MHEDALFNSLKHFLYLSSCDNAALVETSLAAFHGLKNPQDNTVNVQRSTETISLPINYGRKPFTDEEMDMINVSESES